MTLKLKKNKRYSKFSVWRLYIGGGEAGRMLRDVWSMVPRTARLEPSTSFPYVDTTPSVTFGGKKNASSSVEAEPTYIYCTQFFKQHDDWINRRGFSSHLYFQNDPLLLLICAYWATKKILTRPKNKRSLKVADGQRSIHLRIEQQQTKITKK
jgi:hypothetical protein